MAKSPVFLSHQDPWLLGYFCKVRPAVVCKPLCCKDMSFYIQDYTVHIARQKNYKKNTAGTFFPRRGIYIGIGIIYWSTKAHTLLYIIMAIQKYSYIYMHGPQGNWISLELFSLSSPEHSSRWISQIVVSGNASWHLQAWAPCRWYILILRKIL